jgi:hypothetical protein
MVSTAGTSLRNKQFNAGTVHAVPAFSLSRAGFVEPLRILRLLSTIRLTNGSRGPVFHDQQIKKQGFAI